jgi:transcriptional regulator with XRE-family HTH domain
MTNTDTVVTSASVEIDPQTLRIKRQERGLTQVELGKLAGITAPYVSQLETGYRDRVSPPTFVALCDALRIPASQRHELRRIRPEVA